MITNGGFQTGAGFGQFLSKTVLAPALGAVAAVMAAFTDNSKFHRFNNGALYSGAAKKVTATAGGTAADIKAIQVIVIGTDANDAPLTESLPVFTVNTPGTVTSVGSFKTVTSIEIPPHDGTGATTSVGLEGGAVDDILAAYTDIGVASVVVTRTITNPAVPRSLTATAGGTNTDVKAISVVVRGTNEDGEAISETLPAFTVDTTGTKNGAKSFKTITTIDVPAHDGNGATTSVGTGSALGVGKKLSRDTLLQTYLGGVREGTRSTVAFSSSALESNTVVLNSALNGTDVIIDFVET